MDSTEVEDMKMDGVDPEEEKVRYESRVSHMSSICRTIILKSDTSSSPVLISVPSAVNLF